MTSTAHDFTGSDFCKLCHLRIEHILGYPDCESASGTETQRTDNAEFWALDKAAHQEREAEFCKTHPDGYYWVRIESVTTVAQLTASQAPKIWHPLDADESDWYHGMENPQVEVLGGPFYPPTVENPWRAAIPQCHWNNCTKLGTKWVGRHTLYCDVHGSPYLLDAPWAELVRKEGQ